jgi:hypothetical protein
MSSLLRSGLVLLLLATLAVPALAQDEEVPVGVWQKEFTIGVNMLQSTYSNNWNGGEKGAINWTGSFDGRVEKQYEGATNWRNTLKLTYGQTHNQERGADGDLYWKRPDKTDDIIHFESFLRWRQGSGWDPYVALDFRSMFDDRSDPANRSLTLNPMTLAPSAGISRKFVDQEKRSLLGRLGLAYPLNTRKFFTEPAPSTSVQRESSQELAAEAVVEYKVGALDERVDWESTLRLMLPFIYSGKTVFENDLSPAEAALWGLPEDIASYTTTLDVDWENTFTANITKVISVRLAIRWVYDKYDNTVTPVVENGSLLNGDVVAQAVRKAGQFRQTLALGLGYTF